MITKETQKADPKLWEKVDRGDFNVVYATPEVLLDKKSHFFNNTIRPEKKNNFKDNLVLIALDEGHTVWDWVSFRKLFKKIGNLRVCFAHIPFVAVSATFPPHVVAYVHRVCRMNTPASIITTNGRRTNINLLVAVQPNKGLDPLLELIPDTITEPEEIAKCLIFVDDVMEAITIARSLRARLQEVLPCHPRAAPSEVIRTYYSSIDEPKKTETLEFIKGGIARITICTDALSLGVDIDDIKSVIQWGVTYKLQHNTLVQRVGRAARSDGVQGIAVIFAPKNILDPVSKASENPEPAQELEIDTNANEDWEDEDDDVGIIPNYQTRDLSRFTLPVERTTEKEVRDLREHMYRRAKKLRDAGEEEQAGARGRYRRVSRKGRTGGRRKARKAVDRIEPGVLWFLNTKGCRHRQILSYLQYPDVFDDAAQLDWCCDRCAVARGMDPAATSTAGISLSMSALLYNDANMPKPKRNTSQLPPVRIKPEQFGIIKPELHRALDIWRQYAMTRLVEVGILFEGLPSEIILPDPILEKVADSCNREMSLAYLERTLTKVGVQLGTSILNDQAVWELHEVIQEILSKSFPTACTLNRME
jgi:superfamily II DNA/RNA helicase